MSQMPAERLGLEGRGVIQEGAFADVVVLDPMNVQDKAVFGKPHQYATGTVHVFVNGIGVIVDGEVTGTRPGRALRHKWQ
jgi:N-acyl-D-aspartate/D-glutamate deacylase